MAVSAHLQKIMERMAPGVISLDGFLGPDARPLNEIIGEDEGELMRLGLTQEQIGGAMERLTKLAMAGLGADMREAGYRVRSSEAMGKLPCPFMHPGLYPKAMIHVEREADGATFVWTVLAAHLIREHGFYQGKGAVYRIKPAEIAEFLAPILAE